MKILQLLWESFGNEDMRDAFLELGHEVIACKTSQEELLSDGIVSKINSAVESCNPDFVFGFNYFPQVAEACKELNIDYYAWVYDNPCVQLYSCTVLYPTNHIFVFDSDTYIRFANQGIETFSYLPMAANPDRLQELVTGSGVSARYIHDISFVGSLYTEEHDFYSRMMAKGISEYSEGYIRGIIEAQKLIYGMSVVEKHLTDEIVADMHNALPLEPDADSAITTKTLFTDYVLNRRITAEERRDLLTLIGQTLPQLNSFSDRTLDLALYTRNKNTVIPGFVNHGTIDHYEGTPRVFGSSRVNLNISLRSIVNGVPFRAFEIMGSGGFLLTTYAGDYGLLGFVDGEDYVSYESREDMLEKCAYYLENETLREEIARNGLEKIKAGHSYIHRAAEMLSINK